MEPLARTRHGDALPATPSLPLAYSVTSPVKKVTTPNSSQLKLLHTASGQVFLLQPQLDALHHLYLPIPLAPAPLVASQTAPRQLATLQLHDDQPLHQARLQLTLNPQALRAVPYAPPCKLQPPSFLTLQAASDHLDNPPASNIIALQGANTLAVLRLQQLQQQQSMSESLLLPLHECLQQQQQLHHHITLTEGPATSGLTAWTPPSPSTCGQSSSAPVKHHQHHQQPSSLLPAYNSVSSAPVECGAGGLNACVVTGPAKGATAPMHDDAAAALERCGSNGGSSGPCVLVAKALTRSDAHTRRLILPRTSVEANLPEVIGKPSYCFEVLDAHNGSVWQFVIRSWPNGANPKPVYVLEHISEYIKAYGVGAGDVLGLCLGKDGKVQVELNSDAVIAAAKRTATAKAKPRRQAKKVNQRLRTQPGQCVASELARTASEQQAVMNAMEVLTSLQAAKKRPLDDMDTVGLLVKRHITGSRRVSASYACGQSEGAYEDNDYGQSDGGEQHCTSESLVVAQAGR